MKTSQKLLFAMSLSLSAHTTFAFGVDYCFTSDITMQNCINLQGGYNTECRKSPLESSLEVQCKIAATAQSLSGLSGSNTIIGGRNSVHTDSTFLMAQLIGFTAWQAYQMAIYSEATDQAQYIPFNQSYQQMLSNEEISTCNSTWGQSGMPDNCLVMTPYLGGLYKFNSSTGGMLLHLHARYSPDSSAPPSLEYPTVYLNTSEAPYEQLLSNLRAWVFDERVDACAAGITKSITLPDANFAPCESSTKVLNSPINFFAAGFSKLAIPFVTNLGTFIINSGSSGNVLANDTSFGNYISPQQVAYAKFGIFLHSYEDRYSHHICTDSSYFYKEEDGNYTSYYPSVECGQGSHFWWHVLEQGTNQDNSNNLEQHQTIRYALDALYDEIQNYARHLNITVTSGLDKLAIINNLVTVIQNPDVVARLTGMVSLMETYGKMPLPGHGSYQLKSIQRWLYDAGAPVADPSLNTAKR